MQILAKSNLKNLGIANIYNYGQWQEFKSFNKRKNENE